jgi:ATP-dependent Lon protease
VDGFLKIPFGKSVPLPVQMSDGVEKCTDFLVKARADMNKHIYGMNDAKIQIMQIMSQWVANPGSAGNVIALHGPAGVGKTSFAKNAIADVLRRPFAFFALGGASDIANFTGHAYTYEGSSWGRITDALMQTGTMNPVVYFDELDKISTTPQGDEIISMLIHLTDRSQNSEFHDRYFAGVDFDMSQCLFVFSFNDIEKVHPILRDRMTIIECGGYGEKDKREILKNYVWPQVLTRLNFSSDQVAFEEDAVKHLIEQYSGSESGVRNLIRAVETMMTRVNMLRLAQHESMKDYPFYLDVKFPMSITKKVIDTLMKDAQKIKQDEAWRSMFT